MTGARGKARTVLVTRPEPEARAVAEALAAEGISVIACPLTEIVPTGAPVVPPAGTEAVLFTSANAARAVAGVAALTELPALCVGARTAEAAAEAGFSRAESADGDAAALVRLVAARGIGRVFHPRGRDVAVDLGAEITAQGIAYADAVVYEARARAALAPEAERALAAGEIGVVAIWSARNGAILARLAAENPAWRLSRTVGVAISARAAGPLAALGLAAIRVADRPDGPAMIAAIRAAAAGTPE
jgi:uroporphyrinogen-III synthase